MLVHRTDISATERLDFEKAIRASGKDPHAFRAELFETSLSEAGPLLRRVHVHVLGSRTAAQYDASGDVSWTGRFALHLALGVFG
jgi:hypothetical protein